MSRCIRTTICIRQRIPTTKILSIGCARIIIPASEAEGQARKLIGNGSVNGNRAEIYGGRMP